jgi:hypothetical protein
MGKNCDANYIVIAAAVYTVLALCRGVLSQLVQFAALVASQPTDRIAALVGNAARPRLTNGD